MSNQSGVLYLVATPIGNLEDVTMRAARVLAEVDLIAAEDTRHSRKLLDHLGINTPMRAYHEHNERSAAEALVDQIRQGRNIAVISDAGTPLIQDPGFRLVQLAHAQGIRVIPVPGASAVVTALSAAGMAAERFIFEGFLPEKPVARRKHLQTLASETRSMVFYEAPHRIVACVLDCVPVFGAKRRACIARELSKYYETIKVDSLESLSQWLQSDESHCRGEFVLIVAGNTDPLTIDEEETGRILKILLQACPLKQATALAAEITGMKKNSLYKLALSLQQPPRNN